MPNLNIDRHIQMRMLKLEELKAEHEDLWESWKVVESKAQPIVALAGIFIAGIFTYIGQLPKDAVSFERCMLIFIALLLVTSMIYALKTIWVVSIDTPYLSSEDIDEIDDILRESNDETELLQRHERLIQSEITRWASVCRITRTSLQKKKRNLTCCLACLSFASVGCLPLAGYMIFWNILKIN